MKRFMQGSFALLNVSRVFLDVEREKTADRTHGALAQLARASALQAECQGFESLKLHHMLLGGEQLLRGLPRWEAAGEWAYSSVG